MSRRRTLEQHRHNLAEIREILNSMKTLAYLESRRLTRFRTAQQTVLDSIETAAVDLLGFYPDTLPAATEAAPLYVLIGSERGFCGDFNQALLRGLDAAPAAGPAGNPRLLAVGRKLHTLIEDDARVVARTAGAGVTDEVTTLLERLVGELDRLRRRHALSSVHCLYHDAGAGDGVTLQQLLPPFRHLQQEPSRFAHPPLLNRPPRAVLLELAEQHLFAALHGMLYSSLLAENQRRAAHLEGAVRHLDEASRTLARRCNMLRQEEIIEEIEVILLNSTSLQGLADAPRR